MEGVLRVYVPLCDEMFWRRVIVRSIVVLGFITLLGLSARKYGKAYRICMAEEDTAGSMRTGSTAGEILKGMIFPGTEDSVLMSGMKKVPDISGSIENREFPIECYPGEEMTDEQSMYEPAEEQMTITDGTEEPGAILPNVDAPPYENTSASIRVILYGSGGIPEISEAVYDLASFSVDMLCIPEKENMIFNGWYMDEACTMPFERTEVLPEVLELYAAWIKKPEVTVDEKGFILDERGYIVGCNANMETVIDGLLCVPSYVECRGIEKGAFDVVKELVYDIYISENITYIAPGAFDSLGCLMYIEVHPRNPSYYSVNGILYNMDGTVEVCPPVHPSVYFK
ncbi:hypothetical protein AALA78_11300 [Lachnospiraceae bacterium 42-17]|jgi:hypothetical protein|nr:hypothetical protein [Dorea sp.]